MKYNHRILVEMMPLLMQDNVKEDAKDVSVAQKKIVFHAKLLI